MNGVAEKWVQSINRPANTNLEQLHAVENPVDELVILGPIGQEFAIVDWRPFEKGAALRKREALSTEMGTWQVRYSPTVAEGWGVRCIVGTIKHMRQHRHTDTCTHR